MRAARTLLLLGTAAGIGCASDPPAEPRLEELRALPYVSQTAVRDEDRGKLGVQVYQPPWAYPGVNVYCSEAQEGAQLLDMQGEVLHEFRGKPCKLIEPYDDESFLMLVYPSGIQRLDWDSNVLWESDGFYHHDLDVTAEGDIWVITTRRTKIRHRDRDLEFRDDRLVRLGPDGRPREGFSLLGALRSIYPQKPLDLLYEATVANDLTPLADDHLVDDVLHANTVELLRRDSVLGPAGSLLVCIRHADLVAVIEPPTRRVTWTYGPGVLDMPHQPTVLPNGNLLIFDNGGERGWSRLIEVEPRAKEIVWEYRSHDPLFYSRSRGSVQPLPNGNVLAAESDRGRLFEVTRDGRIVWEYWAPESEGADGSFLRRTIYRATRWTPEIVSHPRFRELWESL